MSYPYYYKKIKIFRNASAMELEQAVNDFLLSLADQDIDDTNIKLHFATDPNYDAVMIEWIEEPQEQEEEGGD